MAIDPPGDRAVVPRPAQKPQQQPKLLDRVRDAIRTRHYSDGQFEERSGMPISHGRMR
jgi:hypothetical protein